MWEQICLLRASHTTLHSHVNKTWNYAHQNINTLTLIIVLTKTSWLRWWKTENYYQCSAVCVQIYFCYVYYSTQTSTIIRSDYCNCLLTLQRGHSPRDRSHCPLPGKGPVFSLLTDSQLQLSQLYHDTNCTVGNTKDTHTKKNKQKHDTIATTHSITILSEVIYGNSSCRLIDMQYIITT